jgi:hypothetical protein
MYGIPSSESPKRSYVISNCSLLFRAIKASSITRLSERTVINVSQPGNESSHLTNSHILHVIVLPFVFNKSFRIRASGAA